MKISFVIPAHNEEHYIKDCIESILKETNGKKYDFEIIVVNNASMDKTEEIAASFKNVKVIDEPKKGLVNARRKGYLFSTGDLIANIDADTRLTPGWVKKVLEEFSADPLLVGLSGPFIPFDLSKKWKVIVKMFYYYAFALYLVNNFVLKRGSMLQGGNFVLLREGLKKAKGYDNKNYTFYGEDADLAMRMYKVGKVKWTFDLPVYSSGRRLAAEGPFTMMVRYTTNYVWVAAFKKPFTKNFVDIRFRRPRELLSIRPRDIRHEWISATFSIVILLLLPVVALVLTAYFLSLVPSHIRVFNS